MHRENGLPDPKHPMLSLLCITPGLILNFKEFACDFYMIGLKHIKTGHRLYGRTKFDHEKGSMVFWKPRQVIEINNLELEEGGYILLFHEDFLLGNVLQREIQNMLSLIMKQMRHCTLHLKKKRPSCGYLNP